MRRRIFVAVTTALVLSASTGIAAANVDGPDVSSYQHGTSLNWTAVHQSGRAFAIVKATEGSGYTNPYFASDWAAIRANGMVRGAYHYARPALPISTAVQQAQRFVQAVGSTDESGDLPPALDLEETGGLGPADLITWAQTFLATVQQATGRLPIIYTYPYFWQNSLLNSTAFTSYPLWIADYSGGAAPHTPLIGGWQHWTLWQYTPNGSIKGISGAVDISHFNGALADLKAFADGSVSQSHTVTTPSAPLMVNAAAGDSRATVSWVPSNNGGSLVRSYTIVVQPGGAHLTVDGRTTHATFGGLSNGTSYNFTVVATNAAGTSQPSGVSNTVVPMIYTSLASSLTPSTVTYGGVTTMTATLRRTDTNAPLSGQSIYAYAKRHEVTRWQLVARLVTPASGVVKLNWRPRGNADFMMRFHGSAGVTAAQTPTRTAWVAPWVRAWLTQGLVHPGQAVNLYGSVSPTDAGQTILRQGWANGRWQTWQSTVISPTGTYSFHIKPTAKGVLTYRVLKPADSNHVATATGKLVLTVR